MLSPSFLLFSFSFFFLFFFFLGKDLDLAHESLALEVAAQDCLQVNHGSVDLAAVLLQELGPLHGLLAPPVRLHRDGCLRLRLDRPVLHNGHLGAERKNKKKEIKEKKEGKREKKMGACVWVRLCICLRLAPRE